MGFLKERSTSLSIFSESHYSARLLRLKYCERCEVVSDEIRSMPSDRRLKSMRVAHHMCMKIIMTTPLEREESHLACMYVYDMAEKSQIRHKTLNVAP